MRLDLENDKKKASSFLFGYYKEYLRQRLGRTLDDVRDSGAIWLFMSPAAQMGTLRYPGRGGKESGESLERGRRHLRGKNKLRLSRLG